VVLGEAALNTLPKKYKKKKRIGRHAKKRLHIFFDEQKSHSRMERGIGTKGLL
jgi:hypothetical protein